MRHGESQWNLENRFTGWYDVDITSKGAGRVIQAGRNLLAAGVLPDVVHTSLQTRAIKTANLSLRESNRLWVPVRRHWRLNERHYGGLTGLDKAATAQEYGDEQVHIWRRSYDTRPPEMSSDHPHNPNIDPRYANLPPDLLPTTECLRDVVDRLLPYWFDAIIPDVRTYGTVLIAAHGNSLRALVKHLANLTEDEIASLDIERGVPLIFEIDSNGRPTTETPIGDRYLR